MSNLYTVVNADFTKKTGALRHALHCDGHAPNLSARHLINKDDEFREMNFYAARTQYLFL